MTRSKASKEKAVVASAIDNDTAVRVAKIIARLLGSKKNEVLKFPLIDDLGALSKQLAVHKKQLSLTKEPEKIALIGNQMRRVLLCVNETQRLLYTQSAEIVSPRKLAMRGVDVLRDEILSLGNEFPDGARFVPTEGTHGALEVITTPVELEGIALGRFRIRFWLESFSQIRNCWAEFDAYSIEPNPSGDGFEHPHVEEGHICMGDAADAICSAMVDCRICDAFTLISSVLHNYGESPYRGMDNWEGGDCPNCGSFADSTQCTICERGMCYDCYTSCTNCEEHVCGSCSSECEMCGEYVCRNCLRSCAECGVNLCQTCAIEDPKNGDKHYCDRCYKEVKNESETEAKEAKAAVAASR